MAQSGPQRPQLVYTQASGTVGTGGAGRGREEIEAETLVKALELARQVEELLEDTRSIASLSEMQAQARLTSAAAEDPCTHSTRMARAMAASLVDELDALVRPSRRTGSS